MGRVVRITWHLVAALSLLTLVVVLILTRPQTTRFALGSTDLYSILVDARLIVDVHNRHGWWNLLDRPLLALWLVPAILLASWLLYPGRRWGWVRKDRLSLIGSTWLLFFAMIMWLPTAITYHDDQILDRFIAAITA